MNLKIVLLGAALMLGGCASPSPSPTVKLNQPPREVSAEELCLYWVQEGEVTQFNLRLKRPMKAPVEGFVDIRYLIDSNGNLFSPEILAAEPAGMLELAALTALSKMRYRVAEQNPEAIPVQVVQRFRLKGTPQ
ncbi:energy transducer TonB [Aeromonas media]|uniref:energy transducer TonB n=1 Tax=Aeromonas media TaxID=651 RepID=UPI000DD0C0FD|nr:energy transducer TonB [Aeromonas media]